jgi:hypothetical protein
MKKIPFLLLISLLFFSCGVFLENSGKKNYTPQEKISQKGLNNYQYDFLYLAQLVEEGFPLLDSIFPKSEREKQKEQILLKLVSVDNNIEFIVQARKYLSNLKNQHTNIYLSQEFKEIYPYSILISSDDWCLANLPRQYDSLLIGKKITEINGLPIKEIENRLIDYTFAENKINQQFEVRNLLLYNRPQYLKETGIIKENSQQLTLKFEDLSEIDLLPVTRETRAEAYDISFKAHPVTNYKNETYFYTINEEENFAYLQFNHCHDKTDILENIESYVKPWLQPIAKRYVMSQFKKEKPSRRIAQFNNPKYPIFKEFVWELVDSLNSNKIENLIIDLRNNPGGNLILGAQLMFFLTDKDTLKDFSYYAFTSDIYKKYFQKEYHELEKNHPEGVPQKKLVMRDLNENLFNEITDKNSKFYIQQNRPIFKGNIYILSNHNTGSAAAMLTTLFQDNEIGTVIGTSVGNNAIGATTLTPMKLPKTKAEISIATTYIERPKKEKGTIQMPDIWVEYTLNDLMNGRDPYLEIVKKQIEKKASH